MEALVTGATGLVGSHLIELLCQENPQITVRAMVRPSSDTEFLTDKHVEMVRADLNEPASLSEAVEGVDAVFHCAAFVSDWASREEMIRINVTGLNHLLEASFNAGVKRFILVSSMAVLGMNRQENLDESAPYVYTGDLYNYTKIEAEKLALEYAGQKGLGVTVLRPPYVYGPRDRQMLPRLVSALKSGSFAYISGGETPFSIVYAGNLAKAMLLGAQRADAQGQIYHITDGVSITRRALVETICESLQLPKPAKSVPYPVAKVACVLMEGAGKILGSKKTPVLNRFRLKFLSTHLTFNIEKAKSQLGYIPLDQKECLEKTLAWYREGKKIFV